MIEKKVRELIEDEVSKMGIRIDSVVYEKEGTNNFLRIVIDRDNIIDIEDADFDEIIPEEEHES